MEFPIVPFKPAFKWDIGLQAGMYRNKVLSVPNGSFVTSYAGAGILTRNGEAANQFYGWVADGVFSTTAEAAAAGLSKKNADGSLSAFAAGDIAR